MTKDSNASESNIAPELVLDNDAIDKVIDAEARISAYHEIFTKYLDAIAEEPNVGRQRYYGVHLEALMEEMAAERSTFTTENSFKSYEKLHCQVADFAVMLAESGDRSKESIAAEAKQIKADGRPRKFEEALHKCVATQVEDHIQKKLIPYAEASENKALVAELIIQNDKLWSKGSPGTKGKEYEVKGKSFWNKCLSSIKDRIWPPKKIKFDVDEATKKFQQQFHAEKNTHIVTSLKDINELTTPAKGPNILNQQITRQINAMDSAQAKTKETALAMPRFKIEEQSKYRSIAPKSTPPKDKLSTKGSVLG